MSGLDDRARTKFDYAIEIVMTVKVIPAKFVKKLAGCDFYEMRVSVGFNEYRTIVFSIDAQNIIEATKIVLINGFLKKSEKDYKKQIQKASNILSNYDYEYK
ncbi:MAG: type II toxin-antitoxin system RelE/ParE family toxin [Fermentimonas sp.]